jgi:hypothetical protein
MMKHGIERSQSENNYSPFFNNCADFARDTLKSGGIESTRNLMPNDFYNPVKQEHSTATESNINF